MRASVAAVLALAACTAVDPDPQWLLRAPAAAEASLAPEVEFTVPAALELGFDDQVAGGRIAAGDRVLFGVRLDRDGETEVRYVQATVLAFEDEEWVIPPHTFVNATDAPITARSRRARVRATVHDADGSVLGEDSVRLDPSDLERGIACACRGDALTEDYGTFATPEVEQATRSAMAIQTLRNVLRVARGSPSLRALLYQVVDVPSLFSVLWHFGVRVSLAENFAGTQRGPATALGPSTVATWQAPIELRLNGAPALRCRLLVADPHSPLALCAGVVAITAASPSHPQRTVTMQLLGARRGGAR